MANRPKPKILLLAKMIDAMIAPDPEVFDVVRAWQADDPVALLRAHGRGIVAMVAGGFERVDGPLLDLLPDLRLIAITAAGYHGIDVAAAAERGIAVTNAGDTSSADVADFAIAMMLAVRREIIACDAYVRADRWPDARMPPPRAIADERFGIVGLGNIGSAIAARLAPFGGEIGWWAPRPRPDTPLRRHATLHELADWATTLFVAPRADESTRGLIDAATIAALGPDGLLVNVSRGFVIDESAMRDALRSGGLGHAALDVFANEPIRGSDWADTPNLLMAPHVSGGTGRAIAGIRAVVLNNIAAMMENGPLANRIG